MEEQTTCTGYVVKEYMGEPVSTRIFLSEPAVEKNYLGYDKYESVDLYGSLCLPPNWFYGKYDKPTKVRLTIKIETIDED